MLTLNQIFSQITNLAAAHNQIAESGVGDFAEWQAKERSYPILWVFHESTSVNQMEIAFSIRLICADRVIVGEEGDNTEGHEQEVISDTLLVLLDFLAYFQQNHSQPYNVVTSATIDPFTERLNDRLAGNSVTIQIRQPFDWNKCQIPQSGASIPPSVDGLTLYNFCDPAVIARLTPAQVACLQSEYALPADITINSAPFGSAPSGGTFNVPVVNGGSNQVGSEQSGEWVIGNSTVTINGTQVADIVAEDSLPIAVELDGNPSGTWNAGTQTWEVTTPPCADATFSIDGTQVDTVASGADLDVSVELNGNPVTPTYNSGTKVIGVTSTPVTGWVRNPDWLPMPTVGAEEFVMLLAVFENRTNRLTMAVSGVALVDYGDGTTVNSNGLAQLKTYDYSTLSGTVSVDPVSGQNYKQVLVKVTRIAANITAITFTGGPVFALDIAATLPNATNLNLVVSNLPLYLCERIVINSVAVGYNTLERLVNGSNRLRVLTFPWGTPTSLGGGASFTSCPIDDLGNVTSSSSTFTSFFGTSQIVKAGTITNNTATNWSFLFDQSALLQELTAVNSTSMTTGLVAFRGCSKLRGTVTVNCPALSNAESMFQNDAQLDGLIFTNAASITNTTNLVNGCRILGNLVMTGLTRGINLTTTNLGNFGMGNFAASLGIAAGVQTITVTGTPFGVLLAALDATAVAIAAVITGKGYTIAN